MKTVTQKDFAASLIYLGGLTMGFAAAHDHPGYAVVFGVGCLVTFIGIILL